MCVCVPFSVTRSIELSIYFTPGLLCFFYTIQVDFFLSLNRIRQQEKKANLVNTTSFSIEDEIYVLSLSHFRQPKKKEKKQVFNAPNFMFLCLYDEQIARANEMEM